uniref:Uncharacterized protein n=1 Tax=Arundo donax TaxID=35708 RepID=A0A0A8XWU2_ARUDO
MGNGFTSKILIVPCLPLMVVLQSPTTWQSLPNSGKMVQVN